MVRRSRQANRTESAARRETTSRANCPANFRKNAQKHNQETFEKCAKETRNTHLETHQQQ
jgi:hypothetical protein